jgi:polar amino acid transport system ATP-binding protein
MPIISMRNVSKFFGEFQALKNVSLDVALGERVVVCGPSGSGKSTLIRCINRLELHEVGEIVVDGTTLTNKPSDLEKIRSTVGMVFQQFNLFPHLTVMDNLCLGPRRVLGLSEEQAQERAMKYLNRIQIPEQAEKFPRQLSGGQQQRAAIARSLCIDVMTELASSSITMIVVTHEMGFARRVADRMVFMDKGEIVEIGVPEDVFTAPKSKRFGTFLNQILNH